MVSAKLFNHPSFHRPWTTSQRNWSVLSRSVTLLLWFALLKMIEEDVRHRSPVAVRLSSCSVNVKINSIEN